MTTDPVRRDDGFGAGPGGYFFLSYASTPPSRQDSRADADGIVDDFFRDLSGAVERLRGLPDLDIGFCDRTLAPGVDRQARILNALGRAEVFVPLYSPRYFTSISAGREWTVFFQRLLAQGVVEPGHHVVPVCWTPLPPGYRPPTGVDVPAEHLAVGNYGDDGLQTMYRLTRHRADYQRVVVEVARAVVRIAEHERVGPGLADPVEDSQLYFPQDTDGPVFAIVVAAPDFVSAGLNRRAAYGQVPAAWRPFGVSEELPLAQDAAAIAARFGFLPRVFSLGDKGDHFAESPGVLLIDPWLATTREGRNHLGRVVGQLPPWALPVFVTAEEEQVSQRLARRFADVAAELTDPGGPARGEAAARPAVTITSLREFGAIFPILVTDAARRYLRHGRVHPAQRGDQAPRPRIKGPDTGPGDKEAR
ncbi:MAG TPA: TIR-like protein FxsC [Actinocrinis sp.]|nr:TIR-like protein FxsC [Actinocrinis sp.]